MIQVGPLHNGPLKTPSNFSDLNKKEDFVFIVGVWWSLRTFLLLSVAVPLMKSVHFHHMVRKHDKTVSTSLNADFMRPRAQKSSHIFLTNSSESSLFQAQLQWLKENVTWSVMERAGCISGLAWRSQTQIDGVRGECRHSWGLVACSTVRAGISESWLWYGLLCHSDLTRSPWDVVHWAQLHQD